LLIHNIFASFLLSWSIFAGPAKVGQRAFSETEWKKIKKIKERKEYGRSSPRVSKAWNVSYGGWQPYRQIFCSLGSYMFAKINSYCPLCPARKQGQVAVFLKRNSQRDWYVPTKKRKRIA